jgi:hypothetical protein
MEEIVRKRRNILASAILTVGTVGSLVAGPVLALTTSAAPAATAAASPNAGYYHG